MLRLEQLERRDAPGRVHIDVITIIGIPARDQQVTLWIHTDREPAHFDKTIALPKGSRFDLIHIRL